jgi:hypothetical protein
MPLVHDGPAAAPPSERQRRARKIKPQLAEGPLLRIAGAGNQAEAEFIQGLLLEEGVPSTVRRAAGADVPDYLAAGRRDVLVAASGADVARDVLLQADLGAALPGDARTPPFRLLGGLLTAIVLVAIVAWIGTELLA